MCTVLYFAGFTVPRSFSVTFSPLALVFVIKSSHEVCEVRVFEYPFLSTHLRGPSYLSLVSFALVALPLFLPLPYVYFLVFPLFFSVTFFLPSFLFKKACFYGDEC